MEGVFFNLGRGYEAKIGGGASALLGETAARLVSGRRAALITDCRVPGEHVSSCAASLGAAGFDVHTLALPSGEGNKTLAALETVYGFLYDSLLTRADAVIAVGGGVVGDIAGFAAATYLRGVGLISVPTTLLAQVDSAYGGKTGVDFRGGKNHIGAFFHPLAVLCDTGFLRTLDGSELRSGMGEVIKYGAIADPALLENVGGVPSDAVIARCADIKRRYTEADELDLGERRVLNFGHTFGHAIEEASGYTVSHGQAVAYGMLAALRLGERLGVTESGAFSAVEEAVKKAGLSADCSHALDKAAPYLSRDKKSDGGSIDFVMLRRVGKPVRMKLDIKALTFDL